MKALVLLGSTGSIGTQTLDVVRDYQDHFRVLGVGARTPAALAVQAHQFHIPLVALATPRHEREQHRQDVQDTFPETTRLLWGQEALVELATHPDADLVVVATTGRAGLDATLAALRAGKTVAIANKEVLVMAGALVTATAAAHGGTILPIDSEHSALWQCLAGEDHAGVESLILTASGGALRHHDLAALETITPEEALRHPTWVMGPKVTIDAATLMNKGLEVIEARWLFDVPLACIRVVMHPTSIVHSLVQFRDGSLKAQLGTPDMKAPIQFALSYPERWPVSAQKLDITAIDPLTFTAPPRGRYPCLDLALQAGQAGGTYPAVLCGADEVAVDLFLRRRIAFTTIARLIQDVLERHTPGDEHSLDAVVAADAWARDECLRVANR